MIAENPCGLELSMMPENARQNSSKSSTPSPLVKAKPEETKEREEGVEISCHDRKKGGAESQSKKQ